MEPKDVLLENIYNIRVCATTDHHVSEWYGILSLSTQEDGEIYLDLSFEEQPAVRILQE